MDVAVFGGWYLERKLWIVETQCGDDIAQGYRDQRKNEMMAQNGKVERVSSGDAKGALWAWFTPLEDFRARGLEEGGGKAEIDPGEKLTLGKFWPGENFYLGEILAWGKINSGKLWPGERGGEENKGGKVQGVSVVSILAPHTDS